jgi:glucosamine--fructose-6-phosphate aminotransferase (isomerizing)
VTLVGNDFPILMFTPTDAGADGMRRLAGSLREKGASLFAADPEAGGLPSLPPDHADADAICLVQSFYGLAVRLAALRGIDVDQPRHLQKVTRTR